jgi:hypothetical protein
MSAGARRAVVLRGVAPRAEVGYRRPRMLRISWPLALVLAAAIFVVARRPRMLPWVLLAFVVWFLVETARRRGRRP